jgi:hypothetical protein
MSFAALKERDEVLDLGSTDALIYINKQAPLASPLAIRVYAPLFSYMRPHLVSEQMWDELIPTMLSNSWSLMCLLGQSGTLLTYRKPSRGVLIARALYERYDEFESLGPRFASPLGTFAIDNTVTSFSGVASWCGITIWNSFRREGVPMKEALERVVALGDAVPLPKSAG